jgi:hypothetical protein
MKGTSRDLRLVPLADVWPPRPGQLLVTMNGGQWDALLAASYEAGAVLLELDDREQPVRAFQKAGTK